MSQIEAASESLRDTVGISSMENKIIVRKYELEDVKSMTAIWNEVVEEGVAFPQEDFLDDVSGRAFLWCGGRYRR